MGRAALIAYGVFAVADVASELADARLLADLLPVVLMPLLAVYFVLSVPRSRPAAVVVVALAFAWMGDSVPGGPLLLIGFFAVTQLGYTLVYAARWRHSLVGRPLLLVVYAVVLVGLVVFVASQSGSFALPVGGYGLLVVTMVALATGVNRLTTLGAVFFLGSDITLGCGLFLQQTHNPLRSAVVMATYLLGQLLIVSGLRRHLRLAAADRPRTVRPSTVSQ